MNTLYPTNSFSLARFKAVLTNEMLNKRTESFKSLGIGYTMFIMIVCAQLTSYISNGFYFCNLANDLKNIYPLMLFAATTAMASFVMHDCKRKEGRISILMLPATAGEKFLARIITIIFYGMIISTAIHVALYYFFIALHFLFQSEANIPDNLFCPLPEIHIFTAAYYFIYVMADIINILSFVMMVVWAFTCYLLGGFIWKTRSWLITSAIMLLVMMSFISITALFVRHDITITAQIANNNFVAYAAIVYAALATLNVWISYRILTRMQIVKRFCC